MNRWMDGLVGGWVSECMNECMDEWIMNGQFNECMYVDGWMNEYTGYEWMSECVNEWMDENELANDLMNVWTHSQTDSVNPVPVLMCCCFRGRQRSCAHWWTNAFRRSTLTPRWGSLTKTSRRELAQSMPLGKPASTTLILVITSWWHYFFSSLWMIVCYRLHNTHSTLT